MHGTELCSKFYNKDIAKLFHNKDISKLFLDGKISRALPETYGIGLAPDTTTRGVCYAHTGNY